MNTNVDFETAKLLKDKGFDVPVKNYYLQSDKIKTIHEGFEDDYWGDNKIVNWNKDINGIKPFTGFISAPTIADVVMWIYEKHNVWISVKKDYHDGLLLGFEAYVDYEDGTFCCETVETPTEAYLQGIKYFLTNQNYIDSLNKNYNFIKK